MASLGWTAAVPAVKGLTGEGAAPSRDPLWMASTSATLEQPTLTAPAPMTAVGVGESIAVGVMGMGGRGIDLAILFGKDPDVRLYAVCDVDRNRAEEAATRVSGNVRSQQPAVVTDYRRLLDDRAIDAIVIATPNHWHAPATILACRAGKHVYVEKPCSHNPQEGEWMVAAARKSSRLVQMGNQRRSWPSIREAVDAIRSGIIGRAYYAQCWYVNRRPSIGRGRSTAAPESFDFDSWQGPAARQPFKDNLHPYNWHWFWHWGNGELGNNGVHFLDVCRWGLNVDFPIEVASSGGRYRYVDDQETPDTQVALYRFDGGKMIRWEGLSCNRLPEGPPPDIVFHGEEGSVAIHGATWIIRDPVGKEIRRNDGTGGDAVHVANFLDAIRLNTPLNSPIEEGHKSTLLCHLGNIAYRTGSVVKMDPVKGRIKGNRPAVSLWGRDYAPGWEKRLRP